MKNLWRINFLRGLAVVGIITFIVKSRVTYDIIFNHD